MALVKLLSQRSHWETFMTYSGVSSVMGRNRFAALLLEEDHAADEIMVPFKEKSHLQQYVLKKPYKWGFKFWGRSGVLGILCDFDICRGSVNKAPTADKTYDLGISSSVVIDLCWHYRMVIISRFLRTTSSQVYH